MRLHEVIGLVGTVAVCHAAAVRPAPAMPQGPDEARALLERVATAAGGEGIEHRITSRVSKGVIVTPAGKAPLTISLKAPDRFLVVIDSPAGGLSRNGFDGKEAWSANERGVTVRTGPEAGFFCREQTLHRETQLATLFASVAVERPAEIDGRSVVVARAVSRDGLTERFSFDASSYLLVRHEVEIGGTLLRADFDDYRTVDGVPVAHRIRRSRPDFAWTTEIGEVRHNMPIDDATFAKPGTR